MISSFGIRKVWFQILASQFICCVSIQVANYNPWSWGPQATKTLREVDLLYSEELWFQGMGNKQEVNNNNIWKILKDLEIRFKN